MPPLRILMMATFRMICRKDLESTIGIIQEQPTKDNGREEKDMGRELGFRVMPPILVTGG